MKCWICNSIDLCDTSPAPQHNRPPDSPHPHTHLGIVLRYHVVRLVWRCLLQERHDQATTQPELVAKMAAELAAQQHFQTGATDHYVGGYTQCVSMQNFTSSHRCASNFVSQHTPLSSNQIGQCCLTAIRSSQGIPWPTLCQVNTIVRQVTLTVKDTDA